MKVDENLMVPDIRPENIETITETYTPSGGGEQTATYKIINVHPILNGILDKLAFFRTHAAAVWYNKLAGRTVADEIKDLKSIGLKYVDASLGNFDIGKYGSADIKSIPGARQYLFATIVNWSVIGLDGIGAFNIVGSGRTFYITGTPDTIVKNVSARFFYIG